MGGLKINTKAQVISCNTNKRIPGLFAAGEVTGGTHGASRLVVCAIADCLHLVWLQEKTSNHA